MTNANAQNAELNLDDLFAEIDGLDLEPTTAVEPVVAPADEISLDDLDGLDALDLDPIVVEAKVEEVPTVEEETPAVEPEPEPEPTKAEKVLATVEDDLDGLFDENDLDESLLSLDDIVVEDAPTVAPETPKAKAKPKKESIGPKLLDEEEPQEPSEPAEAKTPAEKPKKKEKSPSTERRTYYNSSKSQVLVDRLGGNTDEIVLEFDDIDLPEDELKKKQRAFLSLLNNQPTTTADGSTVQKKVAEKVIILFTMFKQKKGWNEVMYRTFKVLLTDGYVNTKKGGNLYQDLIAKPYSEGTANAQAGQMGQMLPLLKIALPDGKGNLVPNENSTILARLREEYFPELSQKAE